MKSIITLAVCGAFVLLSNATHAQVVGGKPKAGGSSAVADHPSPSPGAAIEPASQTNEQANGAKLGSNQNGYGTGDKAKTNDTGTDQTKATGGSGKKAKTKKQKKSSSKSDDTENKSSSSAEATPKTDSSPH